eukprot:Clim_evm36s231 gene=Clim_evmTU36s231
MEERWQNSEDAIRQKIVEGDVTDLKSNPPRFVAGLDISFIKGNDNKALAMAVICRWDTMEVVAERYEWVTLTEPYIASYLGFREAPALTQQLLLLIRDFPQYMPSLILVDGNGRLHPRGCGAACHIGTAVADSLEGRIIPTVGVSKNWLLVDGVTLDDVRTMSAKNLHKAGDTMTISGQSSGQPMATAVLRGGATSKPVFVSVGHGVTLETATTLVKDCGLNFRIPEPIRQADLRSRDLVRKEYLTQPSSKENSS